MAVPMTTLAELREELGLTQQQLADKLGVSKQTVSAWENGRLRIRRNHAIEIGKLFKVSADAITNNQSNDTIPFYNMVHAGPMFDPGESQLDVTRVDRRGFTKHPRAFVLRVVGDSMEPHIFSGTDLFCEPLEDEEDIANLVDGRDVVVTVQTKGGTSCQVGKWRWLDPNHFELVKVNPKYAPQAFLFDRDTVARIAVVVASCREHR